MSPLDQPHHTAPTELFTLVDVCVTREGKLILSHITDHFHEGRATALVGPSGSGKSTLLRLLNRLEEPTSGQIYFHGSPLDTLDVHLLRRRVGLVGQQAVMLAATVEQEVSYGSPGLPQSAVRQLLRRVNLDEVSLDQSTSGLSGGERQRLALARTLAVDPQVLLLDEPTSSLDTKAAEAVDQVIKDLVREGLSVVLVSHDLDRAAAVTDDALVLDKGTLVDRGDPRSVRYLVE